MILEGFHLGLLQDLAGISHPALLVDEPPTVLGSPGPCP